MRLVKLPQHTYHPETNPAPPPVFIDPEAVGVVVDVTPSKADDERPVTQVVVAGGFFDIPLPVEDVLRVLGATVTEVVFRDVTPS